MKQIAHFFAKFHFHCPGHQKFVVPTGFFQIHIPLLGGSFKQFLFFTPKIGEDESISTNIFQMGWNHPTSC